MYNKQLNKQVKSYLEVEIPLDHESEWYIDLKDFSRGMPINWQKGYWHITIVFIDATSDTEAVSEIIVRHLSSLGEQMIILDRLEAFTSTGGGTHIIHLSASDIPEEFLRTVKGIRKDLAECGCRIQSSFKLHVTLGRADASKLEPEEIKALLDEVDYTPFRVTLRKYNYRIFRGPVIREWELE